MMNRFAKRMIVLLFVCTMIFAFVSVAAAEEPEYAEDGTILFEDTFESGDDSNQNEYFKWGPTRGNDTGSLDISTDIARSGDYSMKFTYEAVPNGIDNWIEKRFDLTTPQNEIWIQWYQYYPDGTEGIGPAWHHREQSSYTNNKLMVLGNGDYGGPSSFGLYYVETERLNDGDSRAMVKWRPNGYSGGEYGKYATDNIGVLQDSSLRGKWVEYITHFKTASGYGQKDGIFEMWVDGKQIHDHHDMNTWPTSGGEELAQYNIFNHGYMMGWSNSGFDETSHTYIDDYTLLDGPPSTIDYVEGPPESIVDINECESTDGTRIFCDDFEMDRLGQYYHYYQTWGRFRNHSRGIDGSGGMTSYFGHYEADPNRDAYDTWLRLAFGKTPDETFYTPVGDTGTSERELYWRFFVRSNTAIEEDMPNSTGPLATVRGFGPDRTEFMKVDISYPDQTGELESQLYAGQFDEAGQPVGTEHISTLRGEKPVMIPQTDSLWHEIEIHVKLNDSGQSNGVYELWIDGELENSQYGVNWVGDYTDYGINAIELTNRINQLGVPSGDLENRTYDNFLLSRSPISNGSVAPQNSTLSSLSVSEGELSPEFHPETHNYTVEVQSDNVDISAVPTVTGASIQLDGQPIESGAENNVILEPGDNQFTIVVNGTDGSVRTYNLNVIRIDTTPPVTSIQINGLKLPNGTYLEYADVQLEAEDDMSGVDRIEYSLDQGSTWNEYEAVLHFTEDTSLQYRAVDVSGNVEGAQSIEIQIVTEVGFDSLYSLIAGIDHPGTGDSIDAQIASASHFFEKGFEALSKVTDKVESYDESKLNGEIRDVLLVLIDYMIEHRITE